MANYVIEGTITEVKINSDGKVEKFKIAGTEAFVLQEKKDNKLEKYNILCSEDKKGEAFIFKSDTEICCNIKLCQYVLSAITANKRIKLILEEKNDGAIEIANRKFNLSSITLLAD